MDTRTYLRHLLPRVSASHRPIYVAVTGHCNLGNAATIAFVKSSFSLLLVELKAGHQPGVVALSGLAIGADTLFAEAALSCAIPLECCIASGDLLENFAPGTELEQHLSLRARSRQVHTLPFRERSNAAYMALGRWLVDSCDLLIAAWNGLPAVAEGGTGDVVAYARAVGRPGIHIDILHHTIGAL
jgi:hypothetical protein